MNGWDDGHNSVCVGYLYFRPVVPLRKKCEVVGVNKPAPSSSPGCGGVICWVKWQASEWCGKARLPFDPTYKQE